MATLVCALLATLLLLAPGVSAGSFSFFGGSGFGSYSGGSYSGGSGSWFSGGGYSSGSSAPSLSSSVTTTAQCSREFGEVAFTFKVANKGNAVARGVTGTIVNGLPAGWSITYDSSCPSGQCTFGDIDAGGDATVYVTATAPSHFTSTSTTLQLNLKDLAVGGTAVSSSSGCSTAATIKTPCTPCAGGTCDCSHPITKPGKIKSAQYFAEVAATDVGECCKTCSKVAGCVFYSFKSDSSSSSSSSSYGGSSSSSSSSSSSDDDDENCKLFKQVDGCPAIDASETEYVTGESCNPKAYGDPHLTGAHATEFDFNGLPDQSFCLVTDRSFHVNMGIEGYWGTPAGLQQEAKKELHTWARSLSVFWLRASQEHKLVLRARSGLETSRAAGPFLTEATLDGAPLEAFQMTGKQVRPVPEAGMVLRFDGVGKYGKDQDTEMYTLVIADHAVLNFVLRPAIKQMRSKSDAFVHFDLMLDELKHSEDVHGVLGQTFRADRSARTCYYQYLASKFNGRMHVDGPHATGAGFLDGVLADYRTPALLDSGCALSRYHGHVPVEVAAWEAPPTDAAVELTEEAVKTAQ